MSNGLHPDDESGPYLSTDISIDRISELFDYVKNYDNNFTYKPANERLVDFENKPMIFYHGTSKFFDSFKFYNGAYGEGAYLTSSIDEAADNG